MAFFNSEEGFVEEVSYFGVFMRRAGISIRPKGLIQNSRLHFLPSLNTGAVPMSHLTSPYRARCDMFHRFESCTKAAKAAFSGTQTQNPSGGLLHLCAGQGSTRFF